MVSRLGHSSLPWLLAVVTLAVLSGSPCVAQGEPQPELLQVRDGFQVEVYANVPYARSLVSIKKDKATITYVGSRLGWGSTLSDVWAVVDTNSDGKPEYTWQLVKNLNTPSGITLDEAADILYVSGFSGDTADDLGKGVIWALKDVSIAALQKKEYKKSDLVVVTDKLPADGWHGWRYLRLDKTGHIIVPVGINCNVCKQDTTADGTKFGTIYKLDPKTGKLTLIADGVRNSVGMDFHPDSGRLYFTENGRDSMGDNIPDCELNVLSEEGQDFGFPYCLSAGRSNATVWQRPRGPGLAVNDPDMNAGGSVRDCTAKDAFVRPVQILGPHTAPLGIKFFRWFKGANFPKAFDRVAFIVLRGSWDRALKIGYHVVTLRLNDKLDPPKSLGYKEFAWGWLQSKDDPVNQYSWGRPADVEFSPDGSLLISDDTAGMVFRVTRQAKKTSSGRRSLL